MTATSATPGWSRRTASLSDGYRFTPPDTTMSDIRSVMKTKPFSST